MPKEKPNALQKAVRGFIRDLLTPDLTTIISDGTNEPPALEERDKPLISDQTIEPKQKRVITLTTRIQVLQRDSRQCVYCGRKPPDVSLEVDHIMPFSKGGSNHISNLQTLCFDCNRGKSNRF